MPAALRAHPELVRLPGIARGWVPHLHVLAASLAADLQLVVGHGCRFYNTVMLAGIILAAGASLRMGRPKALLPCADGRSFLATLAGKFAAAGLLRVVVVVRAGADEIRADVERGNLPVVLAENPDPARGQLSSLLAGIDALAAADLEAVAVMPVDQPLVSEETI
ncbi:MAG: hypothetical protein EHM13_08865, partial [Acidobacteria bacterium]